MVAPFGLVLSSRPTVSPRRDSGRGCASVVLVSRSLSPVGSSSGSLVLIASSLDQFQGTGDDAARCQPVVLVQFGGHAHLAVSYTHLRAHETRHDLVCRLLLEKKKKKT